MKDYLETEGYQVKSPRETIKVAFQIGIIQDGHIWIEALSSRNLTSHTYDEALAEKLIQLIKEKYIPELHKPHEKLAKER